MKTKDEYSKLLYFFAKSRHFNLEVLEILENELLKHSMYLTKYEVYQKVINFWSFSILRHHNYSMKYVENFNEFIKLIDNDKIDISKDHLPLILLSYSHINENLDLEVMKLIIQRCMDSINKLNYHNLTVIVQSLARMNIRNEAAFTAVANRIITDIENENDIEIKAKEAAQIFSSFVKVEFYDLRLMRALEDLFVLNIKNSTSLTV